MIVGKIHLLSVKSATEIFKGMLDLGCHITKNLEEHLVPKSPAL